MDSLTWHSVLKWNAGLMFVLLLAVRPVFCAGGNGRNVLGNPPFRPDRAFSLSFPDSSGRQYLLNRQFIRHYRQTYSTVEYANLLEQYRLYGWDQPLDVLRFNNTLLRHEQNIQHYSNNLYKIRQQEFSRMLKTPQYLLEKRLLVALNYLLTENIHPSNFGKSSILQLKTQDKLTKNAALNAMHKAIGTQKVKKVPGYVALDIHVHSHHSFDGTSDPENLLVSAHEKGFEAIAITDHDYFDDAHYIERLALDLKRQGKLPANFVVIPGMEISTRDGHILGLFLEYYIPPGMSAQQTIKAIHKQQGLAIAPHPYQRDFGVGPTLVKQLPFDGIVVTGVGPEFSLALQLAEDVQENTALFMGSDTHLENGLAWLGYTLVETVDQSFEGIKSAIRKGKTKPVYRNLMKYQLTVASSGIAKSITTPFTRIYQLRYTLETTLAGLMFADQVRVHSVLTDLLLDIRSMEIAIPGHDTSIIDTQFIQGLSAYYGPMYLSITRLDGRPVMVAGINLYY